MFMELYTDLSLDEVVKHLSNCRVGGCFGAVEQDKRGLFGNWDYGVFSIKPLSDEYHPELKEVHNLPVTLKTRVWFSTQPYYEGQIALYRVVTHLLENWPGDMALLNYGETVMVQRVDGRILMRVEQMNEDIRPIFASFDFEPF